MGKMKKKYESGEASQYMSRKMALRKLQLSLKMFRRLCILKGIYPREPKNRKRAQKGSTEKKTLYLKKDIQFLLHEPIMWKLREHKVFLRKKNRAKMLRDKDTMRRVLENRPTYRLDHIVKERYPTFIDALRDLDDCLTLCFLFSTFPSLRFVPGGVSKFCRRLTVEFMHYVIEARALRKVFVSIKGYYFQADIKGQTVTWIVPHNFGFQPQTSADVDFRIMATFVEFYNTVLGFVNFRLFHSLNICYPPKLIFLAGTEKKDNEEEKELATEEELVSERVAALNQRLLRAEDVAEEQVPEIDEFLQGEDQAKLEEMRKEAEKVKKLKSLFEGMKFFLNREVPREPLTFVIRSAGGQVSWDKQLFPGAIFSEDDKTITHHIVDRNSNEKQHLSRYYIQPQWVFDCFNSRKLIAVEKYFPGAVLPPHLSPFLTEREGDYVPPEKKKFFDMEKGIQIPTEPMEMNAEQEEQNKSVEEEDESSDDEIDEVDDGDEEEDVEQSEEEVEEEEEELDEAEANRKALKKQMAVEKGVVEEIDEIKMKEGEDREQYRLRVMMIRNKHKRLYKRMMDSRHRRRREADRLTSKRTQIEESEKAKKKSSKKKLT